MPRWPDLICSQCLVARLVFVRIQKGGSEAANGWRQIRKGPLVTKELYTVAQFCEAYGIGRTTFYAEVKAGRLRTVKIGAATRVRRTDAETWANSLPGQAAA